MDYSFIYQKTFENPNYSNSHHIQYDYVMDKLNLKLKEQDGNLSLIDIGSGRGQLIKYISDIYSKQIRITSLDVSKFHNYDVDFINCDLSKKEDLDKLKNFKFDILTCTDVFEHLDKSFIDNVIDMCSQIGTYCLFVIANHSDKWNNIELHTIQENIEWWREKLIKYFTINSEKSLYKGGWLYFFECVKK
jgi:cyclopropane fatty-acyl-phospholipid synthase-like methyltransferase